MNLITNIFHFELSFIPQFLLSKMALIAGDFMPFVRNLFRIIFNFLESFLDSDSKVGFISLANYTTLAIRILQNFPIFFQSPDSKNFRRDVGRLLDQYWSNIGNL